MLRKTSKCGMINCKADIVRFGNQCVSWLFNLYIITIVLRIYLYIALYHSIRWMCIVWLFHLH